jgi:hypothetical protein
MLQFDPDCKEGAMAKSKDKGQKNIKKPKKDKAKK